MAGTGRVLTRHGNERLGKPLGRGYIHYINYKVKERDLIMAKDRFTDQMQAYGRWKHDLIQTIGQYQKWLEANGLSDAEAELRIFELLNTLRADHLTIAFVAEFARGKTELINAIFFSEYDRRLLPSEAGRTTMCPTELFYDTESDQSYIRLLPIETRLEDMSIAEQKLNPINWTTIDLDTDSSESMADAFREVIRTKRVSAEEAHRLGLYDEAHGDASHIDIPMWRHALISFPHPLLKDGLSILDTPGLNALGSEPELTLNMLPNAQAVVFVLAADTGVTKSDLGMWQHHVKALGRDSEHGRLVVLNKIDTLWDELKDPTTIDTTIAAQCRTTAELLGVTPDNVFPVSAQKGLLAKIRHDKELLGRSNILSLEAIFSNEILPNRQQIVRDNVVAEIGTMAMSSRNLVSSRLDSVRSQLQELQGLSGKNEDVIQHLMKKTRDEQVAYHKSVESFQGNKRLYAEQQKKLLAQLSVTELDKHVTKTRQSMTNSWTTMGMKQGMKTFFEGVTERMKQVSQQVNQANMLVQTIYRQFQKDHGMTGIKPRLFSITRYNRELERLYHEAEAYRTSPVSTMTEQSFVVKKFFISMVSHARNIFFNAHHDAETWGKAALAPLVEQIREHKDQIEKRLESLRRINESRDTLQGRIETLQKNAAALESQLSDIDALLETINKPLDSFIVAETPAARAAG